MRITIVVGNTPFDLGGGAEYQSYFIAREFGRHGHQVTFLAIDTSQQAEYEEEGIRYHKIPGERLIGAKSYREALCNELLRHPADICYLRSFDALPLFVPLCQSQNTPLIYCSSSLMDCSPIIPSYWPRNVIKHLRSFLALGHVTSIVSVSALQRLRLQRWFPHVPIVTIFDAQSTPSSNELHTGTSGQIIWVNNLKRLKRPELVVALARRLPEYKFIMIGRQASGRYGRWISREISRAPQNMNYLGSQPIARVNELISQSDLLLYTSLRVEGFGDSFIQAWMRRVPTVSLQFDPDGIIERQVVGRCAQTFEELVTAVRKLMDDQLLRTEMGYRAAEYALSQYRLEQMVMQYEILFRNLTDSSHDLGG